MKSPFLFVLTLLLAACSSENNDSEDTIDLRAENFPQRWELTAMSGSVAGIPPTTGEDMEWQEYYLLHENGTFLKSRTTDEGTIQEEGSFQIVELSDGSYLELTYPEKNGLVGNCSNEPIETLRLESDTQLIGTWWACDGPGLFYDRTE